MVKLLIEDISTGVKRIAASIMAIIQLFNIQLTTSEQFGEGQRCTKIRGCGWDRPFPTMPEPESELYVLANDVMVGGVGRGSTSLQPCLIPKIDDQQPFFKKSLRRRRSSLGLLRHHWFDKGVHVKMICEARQHFSWGELLNHNQICRIPTVSYPTYQFIPLKGMIQ